MQLIVEEGRLVVLALCGAKTKAEIEFRNECDSHVDSTICVEASKYK